MSPRIAIIGAGIAGLTAGIALRRHGFSVDIYEKIPKISPVGAGLTLQPNVMQVLSSLDLLPTIRTQASSIHSMGIGARRGKQVKQIYLEKSIKSRGKETFGIHRAALHEILLEKLGTGGLHLGKNLRGIEGKGERLQLSFNDGSKADAEIVIGADGINSGVRRLLHGDEQPRYAGYTCFRGIAEIEDGSLNHKAFEYWGKGDRFGGVSISDNTFYWYAPINQEAGLMRANPKTFLQNHYKNWTSQVTKIIERTPKEAIIQNTIIQNKRKIDKVQY